MKVYLVEGKIGEKMEPVAIKTDKDVAFLVARLYAENLVTEIDTDKEYFQGIGLQDHWHNIGKEGL